MPYGFEWDPKKAASNVKDHGVSFDEATTVLVDMLAMNMPDPDHSEGEQRHERASSAPDSRRVTRDGHMRTTNSRKPIADADTMRPEYDFSNAVRGVTAARYAQGTNLVLLDPDVAQLFPDTRAVNEALRTFARLARVALRPKARHKRTA